MKRPADRVQLAATASLAVILGLAWLATLRAVFRIDAVAYALASFIFSLDLIDMIVRLQRRGVFAHTPARDVQTSIPLASTASAAVSRLPLRPYALVFSVHNLEQQADEFIAAIAPHRERTWIVDDCSSDNTTLRLRAAGLRCLQSSNNVKKPAALRSLLAHLPPDIHTVIVLDPDSFLHVNADSPWAGIEECVQDFQHSGAAALCPRVTVAGERLLEAFQQLEYALASRIGRRSLGDFCTTPGVALYRREALEWALSQHSLSVYAEDLENAVLLLGRGDRIYYDDRLVAVTEGKRDLRSWFSQRVGWYFGLAKVYAERRRTIWTVGRRSPATFYQYLIYLGGFGLLACPLKVASCAILILSLANGVDHLLGLDLIADTPLTDPLLFALVYVKYLVLMAFAAIVAVPERERAVLLPLVPFYFFYVLAQIPPMTLGYLDWLAVKVLGRRLHGDHYDIEPRQRQALQTP